jgi:hypothetical protein
MLIDIDCIEDKKRRTQPRSFASVPATSDDCFNFVHFSPRMQRVGHSLAANLLLLADPLCRYLSK